MIGCGLVLALTPAVADAHARHHHRRHAQRASAPAYVERRNPFNAAYALAVGYWGAKPCGGDVRFVWAPPPANDEPVAAGSGVSMWSAWDTGTPDQNNELAPQPFTGCVIGVNPARWATLEFMAYTAWPEFAVGVIHEAGHLLGHAHSSDGASMMYPEPNPRVELTGAWLWAP